MIALNEATPSAAEVPFFMPTVANPLVGLTGHVFTLGEVQIMLPGGSWTNAALSSIVEKGFGRYCVRLDATQTTVAGNVYVRSVVSGAQNYTGIEEIGQAGGDMFEDVGGRVPFYLPNASDPVFGAPVTGHVFSLGEVQVCLPNAGYVNASLLNISEVGFGMYEVAVTPAQAVRGKVFVYASVTGAQRFEGYATVLNAGTATPVPIPPAPTPVTTPLLAGSTAIVSHVLAAVNRLPSQFRSN